MRIFPAILVLGLIGFGYVYHQEQAGETAPLSKLLSSGATWASTVIDGDSSADEEDSTASPSGSEGEATLDSEAVEMNGLAEVFRFDLTPIQVRQASNRVNSNLVEGRLRGFRLPLVTGDAEHDLSGSLVYYFDGNQLRRITFVGSSVNPRPFIGFLHKQFGFQRANSRNPNVETYSARRTCSGLLRITPASRSEARCQIDLSIAR